MCGFVLNINKTVRKTLCPDLAIIKRLIAKGRTYGMGWLIDDESGAIERWEPDGGDIDRDDGDPDYRAAGPDVDADVHDVYSDDGSVQSDEY